MKVTDILGVDADDSVSVPFYDVSVAAGSPAYIPTYFESTINVGKELIHNPKTTFCVRVNGQSMIDAGIDDGDLLVVDRSMEPENKNIILAVINGEYTVKRLYKNGEDLFLQPENLNHNPIKITPYMDFRIWGVVTGLIKKLL
ncbi:MAG: translesion error-prone DNA polymerase V autoproteolytic subunit [Owenweeksia sp.]|nr:translesion error-prone DNA polymerase V autoproteolytic subunit [Owenweeksia sp.]